jgi:hypothetical protein
MIKLQLLLHGPRRVPAHTFAKTVERALPELLARQPDQLKLTLTTKSPPRLSIIPFSRRPLALFSIWTYQPELDWHAPLRSLGELAGYQVTESIPLAYERDWPDGEATPGVGLLTLFRSRPGLDRQAFLDAWHGHHSPLSLEIHPLYCYVRNVVDRPVIEGSYRWDGIVEEQFLRADDLLNPLRFFGRGNPTAMVRNMVRVALDIRRFIDLRTMQTYWVSEYWARS